ncbi:hypothetical protein PR048_003355 [Dryococelus australis]|uniref:Uncharacterized protein n=1 Tax=Dryococelus australis TaxID=614101 RepID=A0ABQ9IMR1_9NEOP|nr:hypothetical protein PR048_003355 [Dryococelus australis]
MWSSTGMKGRGKRLATSSGIILTCENPGETPPGIETRCEANSLTTIPPRPLKRSQNLDSKSLGDAKAKIDWTAWFKIARNHSTALSLTNWFTHAHAHTHDDLKFFERRLALAYHQGGTGSIPGGANPGSSHMGNAPIVKTQQTDLTCTVQRHGGNTVRLARRSDEALEVRVSVARIAPSLLDLGGAATSHSRLTDSPFGRLQQKQSGNRSQSLTQPIRGSSRAHQRCHRATLRSTYLLCWARPCVCVCVTARSSTNPLLRARCIRVAAESSHMHTQHDEATAHQFRALHLVAMAHLMRDDNVALKVPAFLGIFFPHTPHSCSSSSFLFFSSLDQTSCELGSVVDVAITVVLHGGGTSSALVNFGEGLVAVGGTRSPPLAYSGGTVFASSTTGRVWAVGNRMAGFTSPPSPYMGVLLLSSGITDPRAEEISYSSTDVSCSTLCQL